MKCTEPPQNHFSYRGCYQYGGDYLDNMEYEYNRDFCDSSNSDSSIVDSRSSSNSDINGYNEYISRRVMLSNNQIKNGNMNQNMNKKDRIKNIMKSTFRLIQGVGAFSRVITKSAVDVLSFWVGLSFDDDDNDNDEDNNKGIDKNKNGIPRRNRGSVNRGSENRGSENRGSGNRGSENNGSENRGRWLIESTVAISSPYNENDSF